MALALGYAVAFEAVREVLVLDEIFAVGDAGFKEKCEKRYRELRKAGHTIVLVSHAPPIVTNFCDRAILLDHERSSLTGRATEVVDAYLQLLTGGSPPAVRRLGAERLMTMPFRIVALIAGRNENDIVGQVVADLIAQGIDVYYIDDASTDGTAETVEAWAGKGVIGIERRPVSDSFHWGDILKRKEQLATELDAAWFVHHDADEFRQSPFPGKTLARLFRSSKSSGTTPSIFAC
jgi:hypothetical protein